jgi:hypothetical protein
MYRFREKCTVEDCNNAFRNYNYDDYDDDSDLSNERGRRQNLSRSFHDTLVSIIAGCHSSLVLRRRRLFRVICLPRWI